MPQDAPVWHVWDDEARTEIQYVWETNDGRVLTSDAGESLGHLDYPKGITSLPDDGDYFNNNVDRMLKMIEK